MPLMTDILSDRDFERAAAAVSQYCGINLHDGKRDLVQARLTKLLRHGGFSAMGDFLDEALAQPGSPAFIELIDALSTNVTSFFREPDHFDYLAQQFLPDLLARRRGAGLRRIRAWSAACSSGEEPYSIAMTLQHALESETTAWDALILATDISTRVLTMAREGVYEPKRAAPVPGHWRVKYLATARGQHPFVQPVPRVRAMVRFARLNLMDPWPFHGPLDFIFCRNVMIYFDKPTQQRLIQRFFDILDPGGMLFTGHSESLTGISHQFRYVKPTIYLKP